MFLNEVNVVPRSTSHVLSLLVYLLPVKSTLCSYREVQEMFTVQGHPAFNSSAQRIAEAIVPLVRVRESRFLNVDYDDRTFTVFFSSSK